MRLPDPTQISISIVLPARNAAPTIGVAIRSLLGQSRPDWELLVVDDGSTDGTGEVVAGFAREDARIRCVRQPHQGIVGALEAGLRLARGQWIARMDADDESDPERLALQGAHLDRHPDLGVVGCLVEFGGDRRIRGGYARHVDWLNSIVTPEQIAWNRFIEEPFAHPSVLFRRELLDRFGGYRTGRFPEDYDLWLRWLEAGVRMAKVERVLLTWNDPPDRLSRTDPRYDPETFYVLKAGYLARAVRAIQRQRSVWIWGAGRPTRRRAEHLTRHGLSLAGYIDIDPRKAGRVLRGRPVVLPEGMPGPEEAVVLGYVAKPGARELIRERLRERGFLEGGDFFMAA